MRGRLTAIKNIAWALAIVLCLLAVFIGLLFSAFTRSAEEQVRGGVVLGAEPEPTVVEETAPIRDPQVIDGTLSVLSETEDAGQAYIDSLTFLIDSTLIGLRDYGILTGGTETDQVWATPSGTLAVMDMDESKIIFPNDGSFVTAANAAMVLQPDILVISVGNDGEAGVGMYEFIDQYEMLISSIRKTSPNTWIVCLPLTSITETYTSSDGVTVELCIEANKWIQQACQDTGAVYADCISLLTEANGYLLQEYASANGKTLNSTGLNQILQYLRYHAIT